MKSSAYDGRGVNSISYTQIQSDLDRQLAKALDVIESRGASSEPVPIACTISCDAVNVVRWLRRSNESPRVYWRNREGDLEIAGVGATLVISGDNSSDLKGAFGRMTDMLAKSPDDSALRFFGGTRFDIERQPDQLWRHFPAVWFVLPRVIVMRENDNYTITATTLWQGGKTIEDLHAELLESLNFSRKTDGSSSVDIPEILSRSDTPSAGDWRTGADRILHEISMKRADKVVLARRSDLQLSERLEPCNYLEVMLPLGQLSYAFIIEPTRTSAFVGLSPERLFKLSGTRLATEAVAGTIAAGNSIAETGVNAARLQQSNKDICEHRYVVDDLRAKLAQLCDAVAVSEANEVVRLAKVQHLVRRFAGTLKAGVTSADVYETIHPTAAVCGTPQQVARELSSEMEGFDRGWYASGVGMVSKTEIDFAVAIRSGLISDDRLSLFAGAGIVRGSHPDAEWLELEQKIAGALEVFSGVRA